MGGAPLVVIVCSQQIDTVRGKRAFKKQGLPSALELAQDADLNAVFHSSCSNNKLITKRSRTAHCMPVASEAMDELDGILVGFEEMLHSQ